MTSSTGSVSAARPNARADVRGNANNETLRLWRVFALVPGDVPNTYTVVSGTLSVCSQNACVLIDSGSTHSFVSHAFSQKLTRPLEQMTYVLSVSTPTGDSMMCSHVYLAYDIMIGDKVLYVDLLPLDISHFDCILGMD